jgi:hypothetical protein
MNKKILHKDVLHGGNLDFFDDGTYLKTNNTTSWWKYENNQIYVKHSEDGNWLDLLTGGPSDKETNKLLIEAIHREIEYQLLDVKE